MKLSGSRAYISPTPVPKMPTGLVELMEGLTKEVLRRNPTDVFEFCAEHIKKLLELRDGRPPDRYLTLEKKIIKANKIVTQRAKQRRQNYDEEMQLNLRKDSLPPQHPSENKEFDAKWEHNLKAQSSLKLEGVSIVNNNKNDNVNNFDLNNTESGNCNRDRSTEIYPKDIKDEDTVEKLNIIEQVSEDPTNTRIEQKLKPNFHVNNCTLDMEKHGINKSDREDISYRAENMVGDTKCVDKIENTESLSVTNIYNIEGINEESEKIEILVKNYSNDKTVLTNNENVLITADTNINQSVKENLKAVNNIHADVSIPDTENKRILNLVQIKIENPAVSNAEVCQENMKVYEDDRDNHKEQINYDENDIGENKIFENDYTNKDTKIITDNKVSTVCDEVNKDKYSHHFKEGNLSSDTGEIEIMDAKCLQKETFRKEYKGGINTDAHDVICINKENIEIKSVNTPTYYAEIEMKSVINDGQFSPESKLNMNENHTNVENANGSESKNKSESEALKINSQGLLDTTIVASNANVTKVQIVNKLSSQYNDQNIDNAINNNFVEINTNEDSTQCLGKTYLREEGNNNSTENSEIKVIKEDVNTDNPLLCEQNKSSIIQNIACNINDKVNSNKETLPNNTCVIETSESKSSKAMDLETAAITIQKVFRNFLFRSKTSSFDESTNIDFIGFEREKNSKDEELTANNQNINMDRRTLGISRMDTVLQTVNEEKSLSVSTDDSSTLSSAATVIQAHIKGFLVRNRLNRNKTISNITLVDSDDPSMSLETEPDPTRNKTVLNIHIVPDGSQFISRDESLLTSVELSLDGSPPLSTNLHPLGYDKSERRKQLKREDAIQSISPPSNSCSRLSEELDSANQMFVNESSMETEQKITDEIPIDSEMIVGANSGDILLKESAVEEQYQDENLTLMSDFKHQAKTEISSDESDVITPFVPTEEKNGDSDNLKLLHSGEFHDLVLPTKVSRSDTSVVRGE